MLVFIAPGLGHVTGMTLLTARDIDYETSLLVNFWIASALAAGVVIGIYLLLYSRLGLGILSVRDDEVAAASVGVNVWRNRFIAYVAAAAGSGLAGAISFYGGAVHYSHNWFRFELGSRHDLHRDHRRNRNTRRANHRDFRLLWRARAFYQRICALR